MSYDTVIELRNLLRYYQMGNENVKALDGVNLNIGRGEYVSIVGPSGSGKTTLFNLIGGLDKPTDGNVFIDGVDISQLDAYELAWLRCRKIGYIFQSFNLIQVLTAVENVALPTVFAGTPTNEGTRKAEKLLEMVGLEDRIHHRPGELSAGQQQRVAIARALANDPAIILADEPTGNLDLNTGMEIIDLLHGLNKSQGLTLVAATHDLKMIKASDRIVWMRDGQVEKIEKS
ncbi:ABC transporter ATP-binding protein [Candidatus Bathyarchaeota archaeon]|jgi:putative ABC transport system ATP-binding protein|nr:ABC transporter ATP-binding protein [Candidatus Bathyarchaeota archaeon]MBT4320846.1 ABC transporter ATP-binding protein [Candidatus Bathyarchaeota archaeon]MBT4423120.1 ABC transporter ATP-binding protein [Candidatus Bathyarchaeota archaeon]MBT5643333.1 ABC transporter ATP-binding protein [Candidatus Bathyarchaeota archaeon]MBT6605496.1 ABC transporter ATP-binding protein [Candidatus Bathyarchaeota archaeon]